MKWLGLLVLMLVLRLGYTQPIQEYWLQARMNGVYELENGSDIEFWGFGDNTPPSPGIRFFCLGRSSDLRKETVL